MRSLLLFHIMECKEEESREDYGRKECPEITGKSILIITCIAAVCSSYGINFWANRRNPFSWHKVVRIITFPLLHHIFVHQSKPCPEESHERANDLTCNHKSQQDGITTKVTLGDVCTEG